MLDNMNRLVVISSVNDQDAPKNFLEITLAKAISSIINRDIAQMYSSILERNFFKTLTSFSPLMAILRASPVSPRDRA